MKKIIMQTKSTKLCWNPMEAFNFTVANEDTNLYSYDMRKLDIATCVHKDFVSAVMDVDYSPTGREFVAGSYDRTVRMFDYNGWTLERLLPHQTHAARVLYALFDGWFVRLQRLGRHEREVLEGGRERAAGHAARRVRKRKHAVQRVVKGAVQAHARNQAHCESPSRPKAIHKANKLRRTMQDAETRKARTSRRARRAGRGEEGIQTRAQEEDPRGGGVINVGRASSRGGRRFVCRTCTVIATLQSAVSRSLPPSLRLVVVVTLA